MECVVSAVVEKRLGALPVAAEFLRRLDLAGTVDRLCPGHDIAHLTHGQVIETLVANRLTAPAPLWRVDDWAREWAVEEVFGIEPELLNDDRLGRALNAIAGHLTELTDSIGARAIGEFGIDVSTCHWDMTSMSLHGAYPADDQDEDYPQVRHGHPKDRRYDLKQIQTGLAVTGGGGIPLLSRVIDGGAAEISQITGTMKALRDSRAEGVPADRGLQARLAPQRHRPDQGRDALDRPGPGLHGRRRGLCRPRPGCGCRRGLHPRPGREHPGRAARDLPRAGGHPRPVRTTQARPAGGSAPDPGATPPATPEVSSGPGTNAWPRPEKSSTSCSAGPAAATTAPSRRSPPASA
ncbi:IS1634 family transposase [Streptomyces sp. NPDC096311]|uniref:DUF4277 domain-containing protein n=1 Tax=Streptomyces sp. NPDC096311 TaxID=3366083 RepID=UPI00381A2A26